MPFSLIYWTKYLSSSAQKGLQGLNFTRHKAGGERKCSGQPRLLLQQCPLLQGDFPPTSSSLLNSKADAFFLGGSESFVFSWLRVGRADACFLTAVAPKRLSQKNKWQNSVTTLYMSNKNYNILMSNCQRINLQSGTKQTCSTKMSQNRHFGKGGITKCQQTPLVSHISLQQLVIVTQCTLHSQREGSTEPKADTWKGALEGVTRGKVTEMAGHMATPGRQALWLTKGAMAASAGRAGQRLHSEQSAPSFL